MGAQKPALVTIVMPALNEERYIAAAIASIVPRSGEVDYELLVVDGGSTDCTRAIVEDMAVANPRIRLIRNEKCIQAAAVNLAAKLADPRSEYLVRADCHATYPDRFVERCVETLRAQQVASVTVAMHAAGRPCLQKAIAASQNSRLGNGGSPHRMGQKSGIVDHGHHAAFHRGTFLKLGGYDESFTHNEDAEFDTRLRRSGQRIYLDSNLTINYYPRADFASLARQYFRYGLGRASTLVKHGTPPKARQLLPVAALLASLASVSAALIDARFLALPAAYAVLSVIWGAVLSLRQRCLCLLLSGPAAVVMHMSWAAGFLRGIGLSRLAIRLPPAGVEPTST
jgi:succinoglycan biosynthesis protein ExoA